MQTIATRFVLLLCFAVLGTAPAHAQDLFLDYVGYDYEDPDPDPLSFGEVGAGYNGLGDVPVLLAPLAPDTASNQYTYFITDLTVNVVNVYGDFMVIDYAGPGTIQVYEDSKTLGTDRDYGTNPPNLVAPPTFTDGTLFLEGSLTSFQFVFNTVTGSGSYEAVFTATGGSQLGNIPVAQRTGWTFAGATENDLHMPVGYLHQIDGQIFLDRPSPIERSSWGRIKSGLPR